MRNITEYQKLLDQYPDTAVLFGSAPGPALAELLLSRRSRSVAVFTGERSADASGNFTRLASYARELAVPVCRFRDIPAEPDIETVRRMVEFLRANAPDTVIALGGGSVMDAAKAAYLVHQAGGEVGDYFGSNQYTGRFPAGQPDRVICFPTTSGTGSEVTPYSNIVDRQRQVKKLISDPAIIPAASFVVPEMTFSLPPAVTLATGCDALAHLVEGFLNLGADQAHPEGNNWALAGIRLIAENLPSAIRNPDPANRTAMAAAAVLGGMVIRYKPTGLPHLCSFSWFGRIEHGLAVAMLLPEAWRYYLGGPSTSAPDENPALAERTMRLAAVFPGNSPAEVIRSFRKFLDVCGVPRQLSEIPGITPELLELTATSAGENRMKLELAPRPVPAEEAAAVIGEILRKS